MSLRAAHLAVLKGLIPRQHQPAVDKLFRDLVFRDEITDYANQQGTLDHGSMSGLSDDDHALYLKEKVSGGLASEIPVHAHTSAAEAGTLDHGTALTGLTDDDHTIYLKEKAAGGLAAEVPTHTHADAANAGTIDHGALTGRDDDDHTQYLLADGTRALSADWDAGDYEIRSSTFESDVATGTAPLTIASTTVVTNLNADKVDGKDETAFVLVDGSRALTGNWDAGSYEIRAQTFESDVATGTAPLTIASTTLVSNLNADSVDGYEPPPVGQMAPEAEDTFDAATVGAVPTGWTEFWQTGVWTAQDYLGSRRARCRRASAAWCALYKTSPGSVSGGSDPLELTGDVMLTSLSSHAGLALFCSGSAGSENGYLFSVYGPSNSIVLFKFSSGTLTYPAFAAKTLAIDTIYHCRARWEVGGALKFRVWADGEAEPETWDVSHTDTSFSSGYIGVYGAGGSSRDNYLDDWAYLRESDSDAADDELVIGADSRLIADGDHTSYLKLTGGDLSGHLNLNNAIYVRGLYSGTYYSILGIAAGGGVQVGHGSRPMRISGSESRPQYNAADLALYSDTWKTVFKSSDTTRNSTTTLAVDPALQFAITSGQTVCFEAFVMYSAVTAAGINWTFNSSASTSAGRWGEPSLEGSNRVLGTGYSHVFVGDPTYYNAYLCGFVTASANGTFSLQWAQYTSNAGNTTVHAGSYLKYKVI